MSGITPFLANQILNQIFRNSGFGHVPLKLSLHTADPGDTGANELIPDVPEGQGLFAERTTIPGNHWNVASGGEITNSHSIVMGVLPAATVTHVGFQTKKAFGDPASKLLFSFVLEAPVVLPEAYFNIFSLEPGDLIVRFSALTGTHVTDAFANKLLNMVCRGDYPSLQIRASLHTADPGDTGTNQVSGSSYFRYPLNAGRWTLADLGSIRNLGRILWPNLPAAEVTHMGFWSLSTFLMSKEFEVTLAAHDTLAIAKDALEINLNSETSSGILTLYIEINGVRRLEVTVPEEDANYLPPGKAGLFSDYVGTLTADQQAAWDNYSITGSGSFADTFTRADADALGAGYDVSTDGTVPMFHIRSNTLRVIGTLSGENCVSSAIPAGQANLENVVHEVTLADHAYNEDPETGEVFVPDIISFIARANQTEIVGQVAYVLSYNVHFIGEVFQLRIYKQTVNSKDDLDVVMLDSLILGFGEDEVEPGSIIRFGAVLE